MRGGRKNGLILYTHDKRGRLAHLLTKEKEMEYRKRVVFVEQEMKKKKKNASFTTGGTMYHLEKRVKLGRDTRAITGRERKGKGGL